MEDRCVRTRMSATSASRTSCFSVSVSGVSCQTAAVRTSTWIELWAASLAMTGDSVVSWLPQMCCEALAPEKEKSPCRRCDTLFRASASIKTCCWLDGHLWLVGRGNQALTLVPLGWVYWTAGTLKFCLHTGCRHKNLPTIPFRLP